MKRAAGITAVVLAACAVLAGCAAPAGEEPVESVAPLAVSTPEATSSPAVDAPAHWGDMTAEEFYLASLAGTWRGEGQPSDAEWLAFGYAACDELAAGADAASVRPLGGEGEDADWNNRGVVSVASNSLCFPG